ncbi:MAG: hypothetical protein QXU18_04275 [Thermoplasmatales archaeon]
MAKYNKPRIPQRIAGFLGTAGEKGIKIKRTITHPHEEALLYGSRKLKAYSKQGTGLKGSVKNRQQTYSPKTRDFVIQNTKTGKILYHSKNPRKRIRRK